MATKSTPLKISDRLLAEISIASSAVLIPRKSKRPTVSAKKNLYLLRLSLEINGNQRRPINTGRIPTYVPIRAKYDIISAVG